MTVSKRTALYLRSAEESDESINSQRERCRGFSDRRGWTVVAEYIDNGVSSSLKERPGMSDLMSLMTKGLIDCVVVDDFARISRNYADLRTFEDFCEQTGIALVDASGNIGTKAFLGNISAIQGL